MREDRALERDAGPPGRRLVDGESLDRDTGFLQRHRDGVDVLGRAVVDRARAVEQGPAARSLQVGPGIPRALVRVLCHRPVVVPVGRSHPRTAVRGETVATLDHVTDRLPRQ